MSADWVTVKGIVDAIFGGHCRVRFVVSVSLFVADELRLMLLKDYATTILTDSAEYFVNSCKPTQ
jgi:hypothetical protein